MLRLSWYAKHSFVYGDTLIILPCNRKVSWSVSSILPNKMGRSALLSHPLALASKLMSSLQHYTVQTLIPSLSHPKAHHTSLHLHHCQSTRFALCSVSKPALNHTSAYDAARDDEKGLRRSKIWKVRTGGGVAFSNNQPEFEILCGLRSWREICSQELLQNLNHSSEDTWRKTWFINQTGIVECMRNIYQI